MSESTTQVNDYFLRYGLEQDPFSAKADAGFYFETPALSQRLDLILHLVEFSHESVMVLGEKGIGKTAMLRRIQARAPATWRVCRVAADPMRDAFALLTEIAAGFELPLGPQAGAESATNAIQAHLRASEQSMLVPVVLIDDAHELPVDSLALLLQLAQPVEQHVRLRLVLFCEPQMTGMLVHPKLRKFKQGIMHTLDIPALNDEQARQYLDARLEYAGLDGESPFDEQLAARLNRTAEGRPGRLNALARQALIGGELAPEKPPSRGAPPRLGGLQRRHVIVAAILLAGSVLMAVLIQEPGRHAQQAGQPKTIPLALPTEKAPVVNTVQSPPAPTQSVPATPPTLHSEGTGPAGQSAIEAPAAEGGQPPAPAAAPALPAPEKQPAVQPQPAKPVPAQTAAPPAEVRKPVAGQPAENPAGGNGAQPAATAKAPAPPAKPAAEKPPAAEKAPPAPKPKPKSEPKPRHTPESADAAWVRAQPRDHYVLQLYASHDMESIRKFLREYRLAGKAHTVPTRRGAKLWYVVLYGSYPDRPAAVRASATLPPRIQQLKPWPRTFAAVSNVLVKKP